MKIIAMMYWMNLKRKNRKAAFILDNTFGLFFFRILKF
jgi:hypothetical protein